jgi:uncharacterized DUF497 family protein
MFSWSDEKAVANLAKHGIDFQDAIRIWDDFVLEARSDRDDE